MPVSHGASECLSRQESLSSPLSARLISMRSPSASLATALLLLILLLLLLLLLLTTTTTLLLLTLLVTLPFSAPPYAAAPPVTSCSWRRSMTSSPPRIGWPASSTKPGCAQLRATECKRGEGEESSAESRRDVCSARHGRRRRGRGRGRLQLWRSGGGNESKGGGSKGSGSGGSGGRQWRTADSPVVQQPLKDLNAHDGEDEEDEPAERAHVGDSGQ